ncbi:MAG: phosphatase PAP2 family protein [Bacteroidota bacterium]|mgnify:FL=1
MKSTFSSHLNSTDIITLAFLFFLTLINIFFFPSITEAFFFIVSNFLGIVAVISVSHKAAIQKNKFFTFVHDWYPLIIIPLVFKETYGMIHPIWQYDFDDVLIAMDRWMFGGDPTKWMQSFSSPLLTELLQLTYASYYLLFIIVGYELFRRYEKKEFHFFVFCIVYGFFLSYIGYFLLPAVGPRFTLHEFNSIDAELPGLFITKHLRSLINAGESIPHNVTNAIDYVQRDVFPSGHTQLTLIVMYFAKKYNVKTQWLIVSLGTLLIFSTVYLHYHYVVDVLAGIIFMWCTLWSGKKMYACKDVHQMTTNN